ncbi:glutamate receptor ionotropic, NMDA 3A-like [Watersipora subatra]|uniref:glutamate receptor ionotropic, NMDA 3A-like n=1 Tax=Watersipora subatra TaxID=2589382 RepID=UPI00355B8E80
MNSKRDDEGRAIADLISASNFPHVDILMQAGYEYDGFQTLVKDLFVDGHEKETIELVFPKEDSVNNLLIRLQNSMSAREDQHDASLEVFLVHCYPSIIHDLIKGAKLLFHDKHIVWILSQTAAEDADLLRSLMSDMITLSLPALDHDWMKNTISFIYEKLSSGHHQLLRKETSCEDGEADVTNILQWKRYINDADLADSGVLNYYSYNINIKLYNESHWKKIAHINSETSQPTSLLRDYLKRNVSQREMFTVVTVLDKPFSMGMIPVTFDGGEHCPTPSIPCLMIPETVIASSGYSADIVKQIFRDYSHNVEQPERPYNTTCCEGLCIDLLQSLSVELQFDYQLYIVPDGQWGAFDVDKGSWSGLVRELLDGRADMVVGPFSITAERSAVIRYSAPFFYSGFSLMSIRRQNDDTKWLSYLNPYPFNAWIIIILAACFTFSILGFFEWRNPRGTNASHDKDKQSYTLGTAIMAVFSLMSGNTISTKSPVSWPGKWIQNVWGFFSIIYLSVYTANLTSSIADSTSLFSFTGIRDEKLKKLNVAAPSNGAIEQYIKLIEPQLYKNMKYYSIETIEEGIAQLRDGRLDVWMHDTPVIDYIIATENRNCTLKKLLTFAVDSYGIGFSREGMTEIKDSIDAKIVDYQMTGYMEKLENVYFSSDQPCYDYLEDAKSIRLELHNAAGLFVTLMAFVVICFLLVGLEHLAYKYLVPYSKRQPGSSFWRSKIIMFLNQRLHRAVEKDGAKSSSVFTQFWKSLIRLKQFFTVDEVSADKKFGLFYQSKQNSLV